MKTNELTGAALNIAVHNLAFPDVPINDNCTAPPYSTDWAFGGPIIEDYRITIQFDGDGIRCDLTTDDGGFFVGFDDSTPLIAAMRCFVASKLGDEVDIPKELT